MTRRNIFQLLTCAVAVSAMEVCGWIGVRPVIEKESAIDRLFVADSHRMMGSIDEIYRGRTRMSALIHKHPFPEGIGYNYMPPAHQRVQSKEP